MDKHKSGYDYDYVQRTIVNRIQEEVLQFNKIPKLQQNIAIGYMTMWAAQSDKYKHDVLCQDGMDGDLVAFFYTSADIVGKERPAYQIGAVWSKHDQEYSFHS